MRENQDLVNRVDLSDLADSSLLEKVHAIWIAYLIANLTADGDFHCN